MISIIDNRNQKEGFEIDNFGYGKWYVQNDLSGKLISCKYKHQAIEIIRNPQKWDI